jgi:hypothetical protein
MAKTYTITGTGISGTPAKVSLSDPRRSGSVSLIGEQAFINLTGGQEDHERLEPMWRKELEVTAFNTADIEELTTADEGQISVSATRTDTGARFFEGFLFPRRYTDTPLLPHDSAVRVMANDGLPLLKNRSLGGLSLSSENRVRVTRVIREILAGLYDTPLPIEVGMRWYPSSGQISSTYFPLDFVRLDPDNFRKRRGEDADYQTQFQVLAQICKAFGLICRQTYRDGRLCWHLRQPDEIDSAGTIPMWTLSASGTTSLGVVDLSLDLDAQINAGDIRRDHSRTFLRARSSVEVAHDHTEVRSFLREPGFENQGVEWDLGADAQVVLHRNEPNSPGERAGDFRLLSTDGPDGATQTSRLISPEPGASLRFSWEAYQGGPFEIQVGTYYVGINDTEITATAAKGETTVSVQPLEAPIPQGSKLPIWTLNPDIFPTTAEFVGYFTASSRAGTGATKIRGELTAQAKANRKILYPSLQGSQTDIGSENFVDPSELDTWYSAEFQFPLVAPDGTAVDAREFTLNVSLSLVDNLELLPVRGGNALNETVSVAGVETPGKTDEITTRVGSGPSETNVARLFGRRFYNKTFEIVDVDAPADTVTVSGKADDDLDFLDIFEIFGSPGNDGEYLLDSDSYDSGADETTIEVRYPNILDDGVGGSVGIGFQGQVDAFFWGVGVDPQTTYPLSELRARRRLRRRRKQGQTYEITPLPTSKFIHGHEVPIFDGTTYTISATRIQPSRGERPITILENTDHGTA